MILIICTKNDLNLTKRYLDMVLGRQKVWTDGMDGRMHRRHHKYIPLTSSVDYKQVKSNGNID